MEWDHRRTKQERVSTPAPVSLACLGYGEYRPSRFLCIAELCSEHIAVGRLVRYLSIFLCQPLVELPDREILKICQVLTPLTLDDLPDLARYCRVEAVKHCADCGV